MLDHNPTTDVDFEGIVVAAGAAGRFGGATPKQFLDLAGRSLLERSVQALAGNPAVRGVVVVLPAAEVAGARAAVVRSWTGVAHVVAGGATRSESVARGLEAAPGARFVLVHDAARPLAPPGLVEAVIQSTRRHGAAVPLLPVEDTVKRIDERDFVAATLDRERLRRAQTPQGARRDWLVAALARARREGLSLTDESAALERDGRRVVAVAGDRDNVKITTPEDLDDARRKLAGAPEFRVGTGYDIHRFGDASRALVLGGVVFESQPGLEGHSDADVVIHAAMDALLGAAALGDIGRHFPPGDSRWAGASSTDLARRIAALLRNEGFEIVNVDLTLLAERPRIHEQSGAMRETIARALDVDPGRIGLKATTMEGLGAIGRGEGIACQAACLLTRSGSRLR